MRARLVISAAMLVLSVCGVRAAAQRGVDYEIVLDRPQTQTVTIRAIVEGVEGDSIDFVLPTWRPGKYVVLDRAGEVRWFRARDAHGDPLVVSKTDKTTWRVETDGADTVVFEYEMYANDLGNRTMHVDDTHAFLSASSTIVYTPERRDEPVRVRVEAPEGWEVATGMAPAEGEDGTFVAPDYDVLIDSPLEIGLHDTLEFEALGVPHEIVIWGTDEYDAGEMTEDFAKIVEAQGEMFGGLPYERYVFLVHASEAGGGATEHLNSTILQTSPETFTSDSRYERWLGTVSHELFHVWNVKHMRPAGLSPYDYTGENYTTLLWVAEGTTSYYDDLMLVRAGLEDPDDYIDGLSGRFERDYRHPGGGVQSLAMSSFDAWIKFNVRGPDRVNTTVNFYGKGALVSMMLDMVIRESSANAAGLDDVMVRLFEETGWGSAGYTPERFQAVAESLAGRDLDRFFDAYVRGTEELDAEGLFDVVGLEVVREEEDDEDEDEGEGGGDDEEGEDGGGDAYVGLDLRGSGGFAEVRGVREDGTAFDAGVQVGDTVVALNGERVTGYNLDDLLEDLAPGDPIELSIVRKGRLRTIGFEAGERDEIELTIRRVEDPTDAQRAAYESWLGQPWPDEPEAEVASVLDAWHEAAAGADLERYFELMADEAVFMGTDATERWDRASFREFATPHFEAGEAWTFHPRDREIAVDGDAAWFDELLDSSSYGQMRGSGVLVREGGEWRIAQYNLSIPLPNAIAKEVVERIAEHEASASVEGAGSAGGS